MNLFQKINFVVACELCIYNASFKRSVHRPPPEMIWLWFTLKRAGFAFTYKPIWTVRPCVKTTDFFKCKSYKDLAFKLFLHFLTPKKLDKSDLPFAELTGKLQFKLAPPWLQIIFCLKCCSAPYNTVKGEVCNFCATSATKQIKMLSFKQVSWTLRLYAIGQTAPPPN